MSFRRQPPLSPSDERFLIVRTMIAECAPGLRTTSPTQGWHRLVSASRGIILVRTRQGVWSSPASSGVWVPAGVTAGLEVCGETSLRVFYVRRTSAVWGQEPTPALCCAVGVSPLLREVMHRIATLSAVDRRVDWHLQLARLLLHEVREGARAPHELVWPRDDRIARIASLVQDDPGDTRVLRELCRGQGVSVRTAQRLFPLQTGLTFDAWR